MSDGIEVVNVECTQLKSKYKLLYSSYHVSVCVNAADMKHAIELLMDAERWPEGVFVKRYIKPKINDTDFANAT